MTADEWARRRAILAGRALVAWDELLGALVLADVTPFADETPAELVGRVPPEVIDDQPTLATIAGTVSAARYAPVPPDEDAVEAAESAVDHLTTELRSRTPWTTRVRVFLDPRPLLPHGRSRTVTDRTRVQPRSI
ncbi:MAG: DUF4129 domain-containing protein [Acidimicrobiia bacterium]|nr:DUF4129 domain-containing protein [Acidimicrobiia bacterium]